VEGLLKCLKELEWELEMMMRRWPNLVLVAHGPVTAAGAESLGVNVNVVSERYDSFQGTVDAVKTKLRGLDSTSM
jgi:uroporphyrinogen-III synthase